MDRLAALAWALAALGVAAAAAAPVAEEACPQTSLAAGLEADDGAEGALGLAQRTQRSLLVPRAGSRAAVAVALPPIAFVKVHKTGGSTMANILQRLALTRDLSLIYPTHSGMVNWVDFQKEVSPAHQYDMICNHQILNLTLTRAYLKPAPFIFTMIREPVAMLDSRFRFHASMAQEAEPLPLWENRLLRMAEDKANYLNPTARDLGWYNGVDIRRDSTSSQNYSRDEDPQAIGAFAAEIERNMGLVLLTEQYDEGVVLLRRRLGLSMDDIVYLRQKNNPVTSEDTPPPTADELKRLDEFFSVDKILYEILSKRFWRDLEAAGGHKAIEGEVEELRSRNKALDEVCRREDHALAECPDVMWMDGFMMLDVLKARPDVLNPQGLD